jgi:hypothetical protein
LLKSRKVLLKDESLAKTKYILPVGRGLVMKKYNFFKKKGLTKKK